LKSIQGQVGVDGAMRLDQYGAGRRALRQILVR
jgi:hypothetical protein